MVIKYQNSCWWSAKISFGTHGSTLLTTWPQLISYLQNLRVLIVYVAENATNTFKPTLGSFFEGLPTSLVVLERILDFLLP
jgi:hypothetical protein